MNDITALVEALEARDKQIADSENRVRQQNRHVCELFDENAALRQRIAELEGAEQKLCAANVTLDARAELAERRVAELESRTVTVKLPSLKQTESGERYVWSDGIFNYRTDAIEILRAAGIQVIEGEQKNG